MEKEEYADNFFNVIKEAKLEIDFFNDIKFSPIDIYSYVVLLLDLDKSTLLNEFLNYCSNTFSELYSSKCEVLINTGNHFESINKNDIALRIYKYALNFGRKRNCI